MVWVVPTPRQLFLALTSPAPCSRSTCRCSEAGRACHLPEQWLRRASRGHPASASYPARPDVCFAWSQPTVAHSPRVPHVFLTSRAFALPPKCSVTSDAAHELTRRRFPTARLRVRPVDTEGVPAKRRAHRAPPPRCTAAHSVLRPAREGVGRGGGRDSPRGSPALPFWGSASYDVICSYSVCSV